MITSSGRAQLGFDIPSLGFGVSGPHGTRVVPQALTARLIRRAIEGGAALFDTAPFYGNAQTRLGRTLKGVARDRVILSSKVKDYTPAGLRQHLETDLRQLGVSYLDFLFLHGPPGALSDEAMTELAKMKTEGVVRALGVCGRGQEIAAVTANGGFDAIMAPAFSPWVSYAAERNLAFLAIEALAGVKRSGGLPTRGDAWRVAKRLRMRLAGAEPSWRAERSARDALNAALAQPGVTSVLITTTRLAHLDACLAAASARA